MTTQIWRTTGNDFLQGLDIQSQENFSSLFLSRLYKCA